MNFKDWILRDPKICGGNPFIKGTETSLKTVLGHLALGDPVENIVKAYSGMSEEGVRAVIAFAASFTDLSLEDLTLPQDGPDKDKLRVKRLMSFAEFYVQNNQFKSAVTIYQRILTAKPNDPEATQKLKDLEKLIKSKN